MTWWNNGDWEGAPVNRVYTLFHELMTACKERQSIVRPSSTALEHYSFLLADGTETVAWPSMAQLVGMPLSHFMARNFPALRDRILQLPGPSWYVDHPNQPNDEGVASLLTMTSWPSEWIDPECITDVRPWIQLREAIGGITKYYATRRLGEITPGARGTYTTHRITHVKDDIPNGAWYEIGGWAFDGAWAAAVSQEEDELTISNLYPMIGWRIRAVAGPGTNPTTTTTTLNRKVAGTIYTTGLVGSLFAWRWVPSLGAPGTTGGSGTYTDGLLKDKPVSLAFEDHAGHTYEITIENDTQSFGSEISTWHNDGSISPDALNSVSFEVTTEPTAVCPWQITKDSHADAASELGDWRLSLNHMEMLFSVNPAILTYG